jgi:pyruvate dehydrogenase E2 component (dihydrolipoamide acetyltransferase)
MAEYRMPSLGADMESATLVEWMVKPGDSVARGDIVASVETEKGIIDIEIFEAGVMERLIVEPGKKVAVGAVLATYAAEGEAAAAEAAPAEAAAAPSPGVAPSEPASAEGAAARQGAAALPAAGPRAEPGAAAEPAARAPDGPEPYARKSAEPDREQRTEGAARPPVSPAAKRRARELGVDAGDVPGTGPHGSVTVEDVEHFAVARSSPAQVEARSDMRSVIAAAMSRSKREIPHYYLGTTIDMTRALAWLEEWNAAHPVTERLLYGVLLLKAVARALEKVPELNGFYLGDGFRPSAEINVGMAVSLRQGGLIAPAIDTVNEKSLPELMVELQGLVQRARAGRLRRHEIASATITVSSLGEGSVETVYPIIHPPQVAIVGFGSITRRPWCADGELAIAPLSTATLAADHRSSDGHRGAVFLTEVDRWLQQPEKL